MTVDLLHAMSNKNGAPVDATSTSVPSMQDKEVRPARVPLTVKLLLSLFSALFLVSGVCIPWAFFSQNRALQREKQGRKFLSARLDELASELAEVKGDYKNLKSLSSLYGKMDNILREQMKTEKEEREGALEDMRGDLEEQKADQNADRRSEREAVAAVRSQLESEKTALERAEKSNFGRRERKLPVLPRVTSEKEKVR